MEKEVLEKEKLESVEETLEEIEVVHESTTEEDTVNQEEVDSVNELESDEEVLKKLASKNIELRKKGRIICQI